MRLSRRLIRVCMVNGYSYTLLITITAKFKPAVPNVINIVILGKPFVSLLDIDVL